MAEHWREVFPPRYRVVQYEDDEAALNALLISATEGGYVLVTSTSRHLIFRKAWGDLKLVGEMGEHS